MAGLNHHGSKQHCLGRRAGRPEDTLAQIDDVSSKLSGEKDKITTRNVEIEIDVTISWLTEE